MKVMEFSLISSAGLETEVGSVGSCTHVPQACYSRLDRLPYARLAQVLEHASVLVAIVVLVTDQATRPWAHKSALLNGPATLPLLEVVVSDVPSVGHSTAMQMSAAASMELVTMMARRVAPAVAAPGQRMSDPLVPSPMADPSAAMTTAVPLVALKPVESSVAMTSADRVAALPLTAH